MKLSEYLNQRHPNGSWVKALSHAEAKLCGISWPLRKGWPTQYAEIEVDADAMRSAISQRLLRRQQAKLQQQHPEIRRAEKKALRAEKRKARAQKNQLKRRKVYEATDAFLATYEWRVVRMKVLKRDGARCACCGATPDDGLKMHVDHIKPRKTHPELSVDLSNLQVLCEVCNHGKGNWDSTDWRKKPAANDALDEEQTAHLRSITHG